MTALEREAVEIAATYCRAPKRLPVTPEEVKARQAELLARVAKKQAGRPDQTWGHG